jgi:hypothetical protein
MQNLVGLKEFRICYSSICTGKMPLQLGDLVFTLIRCDYISQNHFIIPLEIYKIFVKLNTRTLQDPNLLVRDAMSTGK